jgi:signal transduction histidine kinase
MGSSSFSTDRLRRASRRPRSSSILLLASSLGLVVLTAILAVAAAWNSRANTRQLLRDYAAFAAWSYGQRLSNELEETAWFSLGPIEHREPHHNASFPAPAALRRYRQANLAGCRCDPPARPATYYRFAIGESSLLTDGPPLNDSVAAAIPSLVRSLVRRDDVGPRSGIARVPGRKDMTAFGLMPTSWGDTIVYGFTFDSAGFLGGFDSILTHASLLPAAVTRGLPNVELLTYEVRDTSGLLYRRGAGWPGDEREWPFIVAETLPPLRGGLIARLTLLPEAAPLLLSGGLPKTPLPLLALVGLLGVAAAGVALLQLRREGELLRLRRDFVAGVSHELRTPLAQLRLFLDTLRLKRYDTLEEQEWLVGHLSRETTRLEHLVENVLAVSRLERNVHSGAPLQPLDLAREVTDAVHAFQPLAASRQAHIECDLECGIEVLADQTAFRQLLLNLLDNAVKFGPPGQVVGVSLHRRDASAELRVSDEGPGVPDPDRKRIWEPYYRGNNPATRAVGGSGIGLTIVRDIAGRFGGAAMVASPVGAGAQFIVTLPLVPAPTGTPT